MPFELALDFDDVLLLPQRSAVKSRSNVCLATQITPTVKLDFPVISINMDCVTGVDMALAMSRYGSTSFFPRFKPAKDQVKDIKKVLNQNQHTIPSIGIKPAEWDRLKLLVDLGIKTITIDVAHAHQDTCLDFIKKIKKEYKRLEIIAGVIATRQGAVDLYKAGADAVRVGLGPGSICTTRVVTGHGMPQITAILEAVKAAKEFGGYLLADGGTHNSGDIVKALAAGADAVVVGSQLAGTDEAPGKIHIIKGKKYKSYNGSTSRTEKKKQFRQNPQDKNSQYITYIEGTEAFVPYKGPVTNVLNQMNAGLRSGFSYSGALNIKQFHNNAHFIRVTSNLVKRNSNRGVKLI